MLGVILAMPIIVYHVFLFVVPGLTAQERRWLFTILPITTLLFLFGLVVTWFIADPDLHQLPEELSGGYLRHPVDGR